MILQLTNIKDKKISADLHLGSWCFDLINEHNKKKIHNYHWSSLDKFTEDSYLIFSIYEKTLKVISNKLNDIHNYDRDIDYWQKIIGPWLLFFVSVIFERYENLNSLKNKKNIVTYIPHYNIKDWIPLDFVDFEDMISRDDWNLFIYSEIIKDLEIINYKYSDQKLINQNLYKRKKEKLSKKVIKSLVYYASKLIPEKYRDICLIETDLKFLKLCEIQTKFKKYPFQYYIREITDKSKINLALRNNKYEHELKNDTEVVRLICRLLIKNLPIAYLESFKKNKKRALSFFPKNPKFILTSMGHLSNELFKIWIAEQSLLKKKICISVHGAHHSNSLFNHPGMFSEIISDTFFSWGWTKNILSSSKLSELKKNKNDYKYNKNETKICFVVYSGNKYSGSISAAPTSTNFLESLDIQKKFFCNINKKLLDNTTIRLREVSKTWELNTFYKSLGINKFSYLETESLKKLVSKNSLFIFSYESTLFFELLTLNIPSILLNEERFWRLNKSGKADYNNLREVNILYDSFYKLSDFVNNNNIDSINKWWLNDNTQRIKNSFLEKNARSNENYINEWINTIKKNINK